MPEGAVVSRGIITRPRVENTLSVALGGFWTCLAGLCLLVFTDWTGECLAALIAGREAFRHSLPLSCADAAERNVTHTLHRPANVTSR